MFGISIIVAIVIGYILKGRLKNLMYLKLRYVSLILIGFLLERGINALLQTQIIKLSPITYCLDGIMYILIFTFILLNKQYKEFIIMGVGFLMNAIVIFANGGAMPVSHVALESMGIINGLTNKGLYFVMEEGTRFKILADIIPISLIKFGFVISIGDIVLCLGMIILIIKGMKTKESYKIYEG